MSKLDMVYSNAELQVMLGKMEAVSGVFYRHAVSIGHHAFIEFTGLMREYIVICSNAVEAGTDFTQTNIHAGDALPLLAHHVDYLAEKFECIFGPTFAKNPDLAKRFVAAVFPYLKVS